MIKSPHTYSEWVKVLDILKSKENDRDCLEAMKKGTIEWQSGVAERFSKRLIDVVNYRMDKAIDKFQLELSHGHGQEGAITRALLSLRNELSFLAKVMDLPCMPEGDRKHYINLVIDQANSIQASLEKSSQHDRSGKMASIVRNNKVNIF